jgi:hypothetical protein
VIDPDHIEQTEVVGYAVYEPPVLILCHPIPIIDRIAPQLSSTAEVVRGHPSLEPWTPVFGQLEQLGMCPDIRTIEGQVYRDIPYQTDPMLAAGFLELGILSPKQELIELMAKYVFFHLGSGLFQGLGMAIP